MSNHCKSLEISKDTSIKRKEYNSSKFKSNRVNISFSDLLERSDDLDFLIKECSRVINILTK